MYERLLLMMNGFKTIWAKKRTNFFGLALKNAFQHHVWRAFKFGLFQLQDYEMQNDRHSLTFAAYQF
jgi:hypothetical protein